MVPQLLGRPPEQRLAAWAFLECLIPTQDRYHTARQADDVFDSGNLAGFSHEACQLACPCEPPKGEAASRLSTDRYMASYRAQLAGAMRASLAPCGAKGVEEAVAQRAGIMFAAFGVHFTTLLEPISAFMKVLPPTMRGSAVFFGSSHPPPSMIMHEVCPSDALPGEGGFRCYISTEPGDSFWMNLVDRPSMQDALISLSLAIRADTFINQADMLVCGGGHSPTLCLFIRMVTGLPMFFNIQAPLTFRMPKDPNLRALLVSYFQQVARPTVASAVQGRTVTSTSLIFFQRQYWVQTGVLLPIVRNQNLYALQAKESDRKPNLECKEVLFWQNHISLTPDCGMGVWRFMKQAVLDSDNSTYTFVFKNVANLPGYREWRKVYALSAEESQTLSYSAMARRFRAAVLFPHDIGMISFDDLYALGIPLFLPNNEFVASMAYAHLANTENYPWYLIREEHAKLMAIRADHDPPLPWDPGWGGREAMQGQRQEVYIGHDLLNLDKLLSAVETSNFALHPHVRRFSSLGGLLRDLSLLTVHDLDKISQDMKQYAREAWEVTADFYRRSLCHLLTVAPEVG